MTLEEIKAKLPSKIFYEYANHKLHSAKRSLTFDRWAPWDQWDYPKQDLIRFKQLLLDNVELIKDKNVVDFACFAGYISLACLHLGAKFVTATNIIEHQLDVADELMKQAGFEDYTLLLADIHDMKTNIKACADADTVILAGIMYHLHDHYQVLESIVSAHPKHIIIDSIETAYTLKNDVAAMEWVLEPVVDDTSGYYRGLKEILVGIPNTKWYDLALDSFGYNKIKESKYDRTEPKLQTSTIHVYQRKDLT